MAKLPALPYVRSGITQGLSANNAYRQFQTLAHENGLQGVRRQDFLRLYSQTRALRGNAAAALAAPKDQQPEPSLIVARDTVRARGYGQWVAIYQRTTGEADFMTMPYLVKSAQPLTPGEAEEQALQYLQTAPEDYDRVTLGVGYLGTERFNPQ